MIVSARASVEDRGRGLDLGADDYLAKPLDLQELLARVRAIMRRPASCTAQATSSAKSIEDLRRRVEQGPA